MEKNITIKIPEAYKPLLGYSPSSVRFLQSKRDYVKAARANLE